MRSLLRLKKKRGGILFLGINQERARLHGGKRSRGELRKKHMPI